jgi:hypothetical protein
MTTFDDLDDAYSNAQPAHAEMPAGSYTIRATAAEPIESQRTGARALRLHFAVMAGPFEGRSLRKDFWLTGGALPISKRHLDTIGFAGLKPSQIEAFRAFDTLPHVIAKVKLREFEGFEYPEPQSFAALPPRAATDSNGSSARQRTDATRARSDGDGSR